MIKAVMLEVIDVNKLLNYYYYYNYFYSTHRAWGIGVWQRGKGWSEKARICVTSLMNVLFLPVPHLTSLCRFRHRSNRRLSYCHHRRQKRNLLSTLKKLISLRAPKRFFFTVAKLNKNDPIEMGTVEKRSNCGPRGYCGAAVDNAAIWG